MDHYPQARHAAVVSTRQVRECVEGAFSLSEFSSCVSVYLSLLPHALVNRALDANLLSVKAEARRLEGDAEESLYGLKRQLFLGEGGEVLSVGHLERCLAGSRGEQAAADCISGALSRLPKGVLSAAVLSARRHPAFLWREEHGRAVQLSELLSRCIDSARTVSEGDLCLGAFIAALPESLAERAERVARERPTPTGPVVYPATLGHRLVRCVSGAAGRDSAIFCVAKLLSRLPGSQVRRARRYAARHRGVAPREARHA